MPANHRHREQAIDDGLAQQAPHRFRLEDSVAKFKGCPYLRMYLPLRVRYTAIVTAKDAALEPPTWW